MPVGEEKAESEQALEQEECRLTRVTSAVVAAALAEKAELLIFLGGGMEEMAESE
jgi:hypothetical protein